MALAGKLQGRAVHTTKATAIQQKLAGLWDRILQDLPGCWENMWLDLPEALPYGSFANTQKSLLGAALVASLW